MHQIEKKGSGNIAVRIVADSICSLSGQRITTFELEYHRFIHAELLTHRVFSRNAASSRAIPVSKMIEHVNNNPAIPIHFGKNQRGMQTHDEHDALITLDGNQHSPRSAWMEAKNSAVKYAKAFDEAKYHKQIVNRILEPFQMMKVIVTATSFDNWFNLRFESFEDYSAQHEIHELAKLMYLAYTEYEHNAYILKKGEWHTPYFADGYWNEEVGKETGVTLDEALKISCSCCAQVSYRKLDDTIEKAVDLYKILVDSEPVHASAFEHPATPIGGEYDKGITHVTTDGIRCSGNFENFIQYRQLIPNHVCKDFILGD